jgi:hypothetical protein
VVKPSYTCVQLDPPALRRVASTPSAAFMGASTNGRSLVYSSNATSLTRWLLLCTVHTTSAMVVGRCASSMPNTCSNELMLETLAGMKRSARSRYSGSVYCGQYSVLLALPPSARVALVANVAPPPKSLALS